MERGRRTSVEAATQQVPLADASREMGRRSGNLSAGPAALDLSSAAVAELGTQGEKTFGRFFRREQSEEERKARVRTQDGAGPDLFAHLKKE